MQAKVPQNVDIEDRVIGPLSLRQFMIILIAVGIILTLHFILQGPLRIVFWMAAVAIGTVTGLIAFSKYGDQNAEIFLAAALTTIGKPKKRVWKKEMIEEIEEAPITITTADEGPRVKSLEEFRDNLSNLAEFVDSGGTVPIGTKDRKIAFSVFRQDEKETPDLLATAEQGGTSVDQMIEKSSATDPKREPLISEIASVSPAKKFEYPKIEIKKF